MPLLGSRDTRQETRCSRANEGIGVARRQRRDDVELAEASEDHDELTSNVGMRFIAQPVCEYGRRGSQTDRPRRPDPLDRVRCSDKQPSLRIVGERRNTRERCVITRGHALWRTYS